MESSSLWPNRRKPLVIGPLGIIRGPEEGAAVLVLRLLRRRQPDWRAVGQALRSLMPASQSPEALRIMPSSSPPNVGSWLLRAIHSGLSGTRHYVSNPEIGVRNVSGLGSHLRDSAHGYRWLPGSAPHPPQILLELTLPLSVPAGSRPGDVIMSGKQFFAEFRFTEFAPPPDESTSGGAKEMPI